MSKAGHPDKSLGLVISELRLQYGRNLGNQILGNPDIVQLGFPALIHRCIGLPGQTIQGKGCQGMNLYLVILDIGKLNQLLYPGAKLLGKGQKLPVTQRDKTTMRLSHLFQQCF